MTDEVRDLNTRAHLCEIVADIVSAFVSNNSVPINDLPSLIASVNEAIEKISFGHPEAVAAAPLEPAVPVKKSVTKDFIICLEDGKKFKSMKRHLASAYGLTPDAYRAKWNLPADYPMVAAGYSAARSQLAKDAGLGTLRVAAKTVVADEKVSEPRATRGRQKKKAA